MFGPLKINRGVYDVDVDYPWLLYPPSRMITMLVCNVVHQHNNIILLLTLMKKQLHHYQTFAKSHGCLISMGYVQEDKLSH